MHSNSTKPNFFVLCFHLSESFYIWGGFSFNKHFMGHISESSSIRLTSLIALWIGLVFPDLLCSVSNICVPGYISMMPDTCLCFQNLQNISQGKYTRLVYLQLNVHPNTNPVEPIATIKPVETILQMISLWSHWRNRTLGHRNLCITCMTLNTFYGLSEPLITYL